MDRTRLGWVLVALGVVLVVLSAFADPLGVGEGGGIGFKQVTGMVVGGVLVVAGLAATYIRRSDGGSAQADV